MSSSLRTIEKPIYRDKLFRVLISLVAAHFIIAFGIEESFFELLLMRDYYISLLGSFVIALLLVNLVYYTTIRLDRSYNWQEHPYARSALQFSFGLLIPSVIAFLLAALYFTINGINILTTVYLKYDFPVIVLFLLLLNLYYIAFYLYLQARKVNTAITSRRPGAPVFMAQQGQKNIPLQVSQVAYFYHAGGVNLARTHEGEDFIITATLDEIQQQTDPLQFFRVNRQMVVQFTACEHFELLPYGKIEVLVKPAFKEPVIVSQKRARSFRQWVEQR